jgi:DNA gyrase/topoisomerase IV subunit A
MGAGTVPKRFTLRSALECFLDFRFETIRRKTAHQLAKVAARAHIVDGLLRALKHVDEVRYKYCYYFITDHTEQASISQLELSQ